MRRVDAMACPTLSTQMPLGCVEVSPECAGASHRAADSPPVSSRSVPTSMLPSFTRGRPILVPLAALLGASLTACAPTAPHPIDTEPAEVRAAREMAALQTVLPSVATLTDSLVTDAWRTDRLVDGGVIARALEGVPGVRQAGVTPGGTGIRVTTTDGISWLQLLYRRDDARGTTGVAPVIESDLTNSSGVGLMPNRRALILAPFQSDFLEPLDEWRALLEDAGFHVTTLANEAATLEQFRLPALSAYQVVVVSTHAVAGVVLDSVEGQARQTGTVLLSGSPDSQVMPTADRGSVVRVVVGKTTRGPQTRVWGISGHAWLTGAKRAPNTTLIVSAPEAGLETRGLSVTAAGGLVQMPAVMSWKGPVAPERVVDAIRLSLGTLLTGTTLEVAGTRVGEQLGAARGVRLVTPLNTVGAWTSAVFGTASPRLVARDSLDVVGSVPLATVSAGALVPLVVTTQRKSLLAERVEVRWGSSPMAYALVRTSATTSAREWRLEVPTRVGGRLPRTEVGHLRAFDFSGAVIGAGSVAVTLCPATGCVRP